MGKYRYVDLHRHDEYSTFDGFGKASELARCAKELGYTGLGLTNHGNTNGLIQHYTGCKEQGIKPILGVVGYFLPKYKPQNRGFHLILIAKNHQGYHNMNRIQFEGEKRKYYNPIWDFELLEKYHEGLICSSACVASFTSQAIVNDRIDIAKKALMKFKEIFGEDFYIEIQPYKISEEGMQEKINVALIKLGKKLGIKCILTSDSHRGYKEDFDSYIKMHEIGALKKKPDERAEYIEHIKATYKERYMPSAEDIRSRFIKMHKGDFKNVEKIADELLANTIEIEDKVEDDIFKDLQQTLPTFCENQNQVLTDKIKVFLKKHHKYNKRYVARIKEEMHVIKSLGFQDYFLIVADYVNWAKKHGINVGPGRGSACNCLVAYCLGITEVDSLLFGLDFRRFLRIDKKKMPDIDVDFETSRRAEVIQYVINKYQGHTARIASYGRYKVDNLVNDLAKVCNLGFTKDTDPEEKAFKKTEIGKIKGVINKYIEDLKLDEVGLLSDPEAKEINEKYDNFLKHFSKLFMKVRFIGTHAAGVAVTGGDILDFTSLRFDSEGDIYTNYDLNDMENIQVIKFDMLGLKTMEELGELRKMTGETVVYDEISKDENLIAEFKDGHTDGIFQFDKKAARDILHEIDCSCFDDIVAANAMNRPGPLSLQMPAHYAENKFNLDVAKESLYYDYTKESYGTVIFQEQIQQICVNIGNMTWGDADKVMKMIGGQSQNEDAKAEFERTKNEMHDKFVSGALKNGLKKSQAEEMFNTMLVYSFNKGHACGYSLLSVEEMFYKYYYPVEFWTCKLRFCPIEADLPKLSASAVKESGCILLLPHINGTTFHSITKVEGELCIQEGLSRVKNVGLKAAQFIEEEKEEGGPFRSRIDFNDRMEPYRRVVNKRVIDALEDSGALEFNKKIYYSRVKKYNAALYSRANRY